MRSIYSLFATPHLPLAIRHSIAIPPDLRYNPSMCFHMTATGEVLPLWSRTAYDEVMLHCARIGFKP
jgi:hypothetical protein